MKTINVSDTLARNIELAREDADFINIEKASIADAMYGLSMAKANVDNDKYIVEKLVTAETIIMEYLFYLDILAKKE